jgi:hypothetical protein
MVTGQEIETRVDLTQANFSYIKDLVNHLTIKSGRCYELVGFLVVMKRSRGRDTIPNSELCSLSSRVLGEDAEFFRRVIFKSTFDTM